MVVPFLSIGKYVPHTNINVKVYSTSSEKKLQGIKITLARNSDKLDEISKTFNEALNFLDKKHISVSYFKRKFSQKNNLTRILDTKEKSINYRRKSNAVRPSSAINNHSMSLRGGL